MGVNYWINTTAGAADWSNTANWSAGAVPANGDDVYLLSGTGDISAGLAQSGVTLASLTIGNAFVGTIGSASAYLAISASVVAIGTPPADGSAGLGSRRINLDLGSNAAVVSVQASNSLALDSPLPAVCLKGANSGNALYVLGGQVGVGVRVPGEASTFPTIGVSGGRLTVGTAVLYTTLTNDGGTVLVQNGQSTSTVECISGTLTTRGTFTLSALKATGGTLSMQHRASSGASVTTTTLGGGILDASGNPAAFTFTNTTLTSGTLKLFSSSQATLGTVTVSTGGKTSLTFQAA